MRRFAGLALLFTLVACGGGGGSGSPGASGSPGGEVNNNDFRVIAPNDVVVDAISPGVSVNIGEATTENGTGNVVITNNAPNEFPLGITSVIWTAQDSAGNEATATQTVTVNDPTSPTPSPPPSPEPPPQTCSASKPFFQQQVWTQVLKSKCIACHNPSGVRSPFNLVDESNADFENLNFAAFKEIAAKKDASNMSLMLTKSTNANSNHGGGAVLSSADPEYALLDEMVSRLAVCVVDIVGTQNVVFASPYQHLRKATFALAGRLPTPQEESQVQSAANDTELSAAMNSILDNVLKEPAFYNRLKEIYNDLLLTDAFLGRAGAKLFLANFANEKYLTRASLKAEGYSGRDANRINRRAGDGIARAPLELVANVVKNDKPFTEILTADYVMVNPYSARIFDAIPSGANNFAFTYGDAANQRDASDFRPAVITDDNNRRYPHAGVLTTLSFLNRYPSTPTNRNRARSRTVFKYFLDTDIEGIASRAELDLENVIGEFPTLEDTQCQVCHKVMDPVAGLFKNWKDEGAFDGNKQNWFSELTPPEMLSPGYTINQADALPSGESGAAIQWLASRIAADNEFAVSTVKTMLRGLIGDKAAEDTLLVEGLKANFVNSVDSNFNLKLLIKDIISSEYFRATNLAIAGNVAPALDLGASRLLSPEQLHRKIEAVTGGYTWGFSGGRNLLDANTFRLLYGGIDSIDVVTRATDPTPMIAAIQDRIASQTSCNVVAADFNIAAGSRVLFPDVEITDIPDAGPGSVKLRTNIQYLHKRILGEALSLDDAEISRTYDLFVAVREVTDGNGVSSYCADGLAGSDPIRVDADRTVRPWTAVVAYLLSDFKFLYE